VLAAVAADKAAAQLPVRSYAEGISRRFDPAEPEVRYQVTVPEARGAYLVEMRVLGLADSALRLRLPNWAPGAYRITHAWRRLRGFAAHDDAGRPLHVTRPDSLTWLVRTDGRAAVTVRYTVPADSAPNHRHYLGEHAGLLDGPHTFLYLDGRQNLGAHVKLVLPSGWRAGTGLASTPDSTVFFAATYDVLIDSPTLMGRFQRWLFGAAGVPHQVLLANHGRPADFDTSAFVDMVRRITEASLAVFGGRAPYQDYTYIYVVGSGGGLEHLNSTTIGLNAQAMRQDIRSAASITAHEFFHTWNVKRIRPRVLGPFDYTGPQRTTELWVAEGWTSYYGGLIQLRSGVITRDAYRRVIQNLISAHQSNPARNVISPERASWTVWDPPEVNGGYSISFYNQGQQLGLLLDIAMRDSTDNRRGMDDLMRLLFARYAGERGYTGAELRAAVNELTGRDFSAFFGRWVSGAEEIPWNDFLSRIGWRVELSGTPPAAAVSELPDAPPRALAIRQAIMNPR
jgi:predicted metalloprotease with PDZ domain